MMKDQLTFPTFTHDAICGYCNDKALYAQYKNDKKSKYIGTKQMWQELSRLQNMLEVARKALSDTNLYLMHEGYFTETEIKERVSWAINSIAHGERLPCEPCAAFEKNLKILGEIWTKAVARDAGVPYSKVLPKRTKK